MVFHENLLKYRKLRGLTQDELAEIMQVSRQSISKWENGEAIPDLAKVIKIAKVLDISIDELCGTANDNKNKLTPNSTELQNSSSPKKAHSMLLVISIVLLCCICCISGYWVGQSRTSHSSVLPTNMDIASVDFSFKNGILTCNFIPEVYSDELSYTVILVDSSGKKKSDIAAFKNGIGSATIKSVYNVAYKVVLEISNGSETRNVTLATRLYANKKTDALYWE